MSEKATTGGGSASQPRAVIHKQILDAAGRHPDASLEELAEAVSGASPALVDKVLAEYGDPSEGGPADGPEPTPPTPTMPDETDSAEAAGTTSRDDHESTARTPRDDESTDAATGAGGAAAGDDTGGPAAPDWEDPTSEGLELSERQRETLRRVHERPGATQADIAADLDVTAATVSRRLNAIDGFEWEDRRAFAESVFGPAAAPAQTDGGAETTDAGGDDTADADDSGPVEDGESDAADAPGEGVATVALDADLAYKLVRVAMESETITEDEERYLLGELIGE